VHGTVGWYLSPVTIEDKVEFDLTGQLASRLQKSIEPVGKKGDPDDKPHQEHHQHHEFLPYRAGKE
jgi:hypothetical protein